VVLRRGHRPGVEPRVEDRLDALRWYFFSAGSPWTNRRVDEQVIDESLRRFLLTLWNTYSFFVTYATLDGWEPPAPGARAPLTHVLDRWVRSRLHGAVAEVTDALEQFDALRAAQAIERLVDDLSNWYVRRSRPRFWKSADPAAHQTLHECLATVALLLGPLCPFVSDELWDNVGGTGESVHLADWPAADPSVVDTALEVGMADTRQLVTLGRAARTDAKIRVRQPLPRALVLVPGGRELDAELVAEVADELNVKHVETITDLASLMDHTVVPSFRRLGPRLGPLMPKVKEALAGVDGGVVSRALEADRRYAFEVDGQTVELLPDDVEVRAVAHDELVLAEENGYAVALDITVGADLRLEGLARELVRTLNDHRKALDLALSDRIRVQLHADSPISDALAAHGDWVAGEILAQQLDVASLADAGSDAVRFEVDGAPFAARVDVV
jgi:isoleucyl-tRNA synthetase